MSKFDVWPGYAASFIRRPREANVGDEAVPEREALAGQFGLIPHWATDTKIACIGEQLVQPVLLAGEHAAKLLSLASNMTQAAQVCFGDKGRT
jgi:hypothetical protein